MKYQVLITSVPDRDNLVAEIWDGENLLAEISKETDLSKIEIYSNDRSMLLQFDDFLEALNQAKDKLLSD